MRSFRWVFAGWVSGLAGRPPPLTPLSPRLTRPFIHGAASACISGRVIAIPSHPTKPSLPSSSSCHRSVAYIMAPPLGPTCQRTKSIRGPAFLCTCSAGHLPPHAALKALACFARSQSKRNSHFPTIKSPACRFRTPARFAVEPTTPIPLPTSQVPARSPDGAFLRLVP